MFVVAIKVSRLLCAWVVTCTDRVARVEAVERIGICDCCGMLLDIGGVIQGLGEWLGTLESLERCLKAEIAARSSLLETLFFAVGHTSL